MSEQTIQSQDIKVVDVFQSFYVVPDYQREYVWEAAQVEQLLGDIHGELAGGDAGKAPEYFIGSIVVCPGKEGGVLDLIDGQQRMTTLFLTLCAIRDRFDTLGLSVPGALGPQIAATSTDTEGNDCFRYRLDLQYEDSVGILERIAKGENPQADKKSTRSIANILNAYKVAGVFLQGEFGEDDKRLRAFYGYVTNKVKLIRIQTEDVAKALKIFETINDRGVGLDAMDLLKNLLFMKASQPQFDSLKKTWKQMQDTIYEMGEKPLRFLRYFILSRYDVDLLREDEIYNWFSRNEPVCGYDREPLAFAKELLEAAKAYRRFLDGLDMEGNKNRFLKNLRILGGSSARQHLILLLAGRHLPERLLGRLAQEVENLFFVYVVTRETTRTFERTFARWASDLRRTETPEEFEALVQRHFVPAKTELSDRFDDAFRRLAFSSLQQYRTRYLLAKLSQHLDWMGFGDTEVTHWLGNYVGYEIEHIFPQTPSEAAVREFGPHDDPNIADKLGNLVLVEKSINASLGNKPYSEKRDVYSQSALLLARAIAEKPKVGVKTKIDIAVAQFEPFEVWNEATVARRQEILRVLAREVWDLPTGRVTP